MNSEIYLQCMFDFVRQAGTIALENMEDSSPGLKPDQTIITKTDRAISKLCHEMLAEILKDPAHILIDEEDPQMASYLDQSRLQKATFIWAVDPIDGTRLYANKIPTFGISLGLLKDRKPWLGVVYFPALNELFFADGNYAYFVQNAFKDNEKKQLIKPRQEELGPRSLFFCNDTFFRKFNWSDRDFHIMIHACAVVNLCWPSIGRSVGCFLKSSLWDFAGSWPIMKAAGLDFRAVKDGKVLEQIDASIFEQKPKAWELKEYYLISSEANYGKIRAKITGLTGL
jgi:fructose-1,6-bisphosphatase/inositol monophosphatase family enzyme